jgi:P27 family predicted phage terminase small subunit
MTGRTDSRPAPPGHLGAKSKRLWRSILDRYGLEDDELATLTLALEAWDIAQTARRKINRDGQMIEDRFGQIKPHPAIQIHRDSLASWSRLLTQIGIPSDPQDRPDRDLRGRFKGGSHAKA